MRKQRILICDEDGAYVRALCAYFISSGHNMEIASYSQTEHFSSERGVFDVSLLGKEFLRVLEKSGEDMSRFGKIFILTGDVNDSSREYTMLYKFQQMRSFLGTLQKYGNHGPRVDPSVLDSCHWTGIYSPIRHELQLLFALAYAKQKREEKSEGELLFLDLEENSLLPELLVDTGRENLMDYLYLLENDQVEDEALLGCFSYYQGVSYLPPVRYFQELVSIDGKRWRRFFASIARLGFGQVVVLFDGSLRGMDALFDYLKELVLLGREGDFYHKYDRQIRSFIKERDRPMMVRETTLPLSGSNLADGTYRFEQLLSGNLSQYARRAIAKT
ncbi:MAG: hypothetical protein IJV04_01030 [Lachnospiraceae bacterium]|nr:hypothetical protein [Lachnospiraceae bacterium]